MTRHHDEAPSTTVTITTLTNYILIKFYSELVAVSPPNFFRTRAIENEAIQRGEASFLIYATKLRISIRKDVSFPLNFDCF